MARIVILEHALQKAVQLPYMVYALAERWRVQGHEVLVHHGTDNAPAGDVAILNVDLTVIPDAYRALLARYPHVVNGATLDISKRRFSRDLVQRDSDWRGPVIVKTDANCGGRPEQLLRTAARRAGLPCDIPIGPATDSYPIYDSLRAVPPDAWTTPGVVVEKFLPEQDDRGYYMRVWIFFGDREGSTRFRAEVPEIKSQHLKEREPIDVPEEIRAWRERLGFDFGKFDYVRHGERYVLLDVNRTPAFPPTLSKDVNATSRLDTLAAGIDAYLR